MMRRAPWLVWVLVLGGCVGGEREADGTSPSVLVDAPGADVPLGSLISLDLAPDEELLLRFLVRDEDVSEPLELRWRVVVGGGPAVVPFFTQTIEPNGGLTHEVVLRLCGEDLVAGACHRIDVAVSGSLLARDEPQFFDVTEPSLDLATAVFWVWAGSAAIDASAAASVVDSCATLATSADGLPPTEH